MTEKKMIEIAKYLKKNGCSFDFNDKFWMDHYLHYYTFKDMIELIDKYSKYVLSKNRLKIKERKKK